MRQGLTLVHFENLTLFSACAIVFNMKKNIHSKYFTESVIKCSCGNELKTGSTKEKISVEICSACHPFYTGQKKIIDTAGRVEKFKARQAKAKTAAKK